MNVNITIRQVRNDLSNYGAKVRVNVSRAQEDAAERILARMIASFHEGKSGRLYWKWMDGRRSLHQASAPGEPPAVWSGTLESSFRVRRINQYGWGIYTDDPKAALLELGGIKIKPRPYILPAAHAEAAGFRASMVRILNIPA